MKRNIRILMKLTVILLCSTIRFAAASDEEGFIEIESPSDGDVFYIGENVPIAFSAYDTWEEYYTVPVVGYYKGGQPDAFDLETGEVAESDEWTSYSWKHPLAAYSPGNYTVSFWNMPGYSDGDVIDDWREWENIPSVSVSFSVRTLQAPKKLRVTVRSKKVVLNFNKVSGASFYEIHRSTKKNRGFKRIGTTKKSAYTDKKVKKGKKYYYKVRAVRDVNGMITSRFCAAKRSSAV